ncbi:hypothetical protein [Jeotgalibacillus terrae]|uniref:DUF4367 domain-containing protein n=1 Tax=Jeotgalibacillus terrae TaxID=587735 RepID=A0ABW5ZKI3_9BACL|nr:hypothetical protein [Jeotgalibacillus terrae]MBM7578185.1 hypothetical protein [Jeotgalibacillus terrae]
MTAGYFIAKNIQAGSQEDQQMNQSAKILSELPLELSKDIPASVKDKLKVPEYLPFEVEKVRGNVEVRMRDANQLKESAENNGSASSSIETAQLSEDELAIEQFFYGDNIHMYLLVEPGGIDVEYANESDVQQLTLSDGSTADYTDYGFSQMVNWLDEETGYHYSMDVIHEEGEQNNRLTEEELVKMVESLEVPTY